MTFKRRDTQRRLEAMKMLGNRWRINWKYKPGRKRRESAMLSEEWWEHMVARVNEGKRSG